jgi:hypothetical protein
MAINNLFIYTFLHELLEMFSMFTDIILAVHEKENRKRSKSLVYCFIRRHNSSLVSTVLAMTLVFKYLHKKKWRGFKSGDHAGQ